MSAALVASSNPAGSTASALATEIRNHQRFFWFALAQLGFHPDELSDTGTGWFVFL